MWCLAGKAVIIHAFTLVQIQHIQFRRHNALTMSNPQNIPRLGYLGPKGSNSHQAAFTALHYFSGTEEQQPPVHLVAYPTVSQLLDATQAGDHTLGILPYENALEGAVVEVLETLGRQDSGIYIQASFLQPIQHALMIHPGHSPETPLHTFYSHPMALGQCKERLWKQYGRSIQLIPTASTAEAAQRLANTPVAQAEGVGVLATAVAASMNRLQILASDLSDHAENVTCFLMASATPQWPSVLPPLKPGGKLKTTLCVGLHEYPGVLTEYLQVFQRYWVNLTKIESRPTRLSFGDYRFFLEAEGNIPSLADGRMLSELQARSRYFHMQGPYPCFNHHISLD
jgi:prephenate dehydratase